MTPTQQIILSIVLVIASALAGRYLPSKKTDAETKKLLHETNSTDLVISDKMLEKWIKIASDAEEKVAQLRQDKASEIILKQETASTLKEVQDALKICKESLEVCRQLHGCGHKEK